MRKVLYFAILVIAYSTIMWAQETHMGFGCSISETWPGDGGDLIAADAGGAFAFIPSDWGFAGMTTIGVSIYQIQNSHLVDGYGLGSEAIFGYGKEIKLQFPWGPPEFRGLLNISGGVHLGTHITGTELSLVEVFSAGPGIFLSAGNNMIGFRADLSFWYDLGGISITRIADTTTTEAGLTRFGGAILMGFKI